MLTLSSLAKQLKLPATVGRPPCPPRSYKKLYTYLEQSLSKTTSRRQVTGTPVRSSPSKTAAVGSTATTPSKTPAKRPVRGPYSKPSVTRTVQSGRIKDAPSWTMPVIRKVCKTLATPTPSTTPYSRPSISLTFPPHIFAGLSSILSLIPTFLADKGDKTTHPSAEFFAAVVTDDPESKDKEYRERVTTLVVALYLVVLRRTRSNAAPMGMDVFSEMSKAGLAGAGLNDEKFARDVETWLRDIFQNGWVQGQEWFRNVPKLSEDDDGLGLADGNGNEDEDDDDDEIVPFKKRRAKNRQNARALSQLDMGGLLPGLGTMMSHRIDWLSEEKRADYLTWKKNILERIRAIEQGAS